MNVIYLSVSCSDSKFEELRKQGITQKLPQAQKYHRLLMEGIADNIDGEVIAISAISTNRRWTKKIRFTREEERVGKIRYIYGSFLNLDGLRQITRLHEAKKDIKRAYKECKDSVIICDVLNQSIAKAARDCGKKLGIPVIGIVTDVPGHTSGARRKTLSLIRQKIDIFASKNAERNLGKYDGYLLLTEAMNDIVNPNQKPYIVLEGHSDSTMAQVDNTLENKAKPKFCMYAGGIHKEFGIKLLVDAFVRGNFADWELHIYGDGNYQHELQEKAAEIPNVKYFGVAANSEIVKQQLAASLLLNPRLTDAEYVKYSFPSKTMECMASGTPLCTTRLPGMPKDYYPYAYFFDNETEEGMLATLQEILAKSPEELHEFGKAAKDFVLAEKTNVSQAKKLIEFAKTLKPRGAKPRKV